MERTIHAQSNIERKKERKKGLLEEEKWAIRMQMYHKSSLSHDLEKLSKWLVCNRLTLNATKTEFMVIGSRQRLSTLSDTLELSIGNVPIEQVSTVKSLGIHIDENLSWHFHIDKLCKKIAFAIGAIKRVKPFVPQSTLLNVYNSLVQSHFDYCSLVWGNSVW